eukprot:scaffold17423_cov52-Cyclotella_meneghiniana.AAC.2
MEQPWRHDRVDEAGRPQPGLSEHRQSRIALLMLCLVGVILPGLVLMDGNVGVREMMLVRVGET